ncbi:MULTISPECIES: SDR family NAD(P)-dependent oxidoreductase [unclassified Rathayibacter]|uniref:SDR family NAD(P)-dependent oxidoreductase n=1 Tax=unclassified Rathayibacter TaxID=2609250 RepID=UPI000F4BFED1|nr:MULTISPECIES: SDR family NAD(P)-dependent oxidoreductase [unclassified Rathayibacter]ROP50182.1 short-subunit dehydrogenase [Rathayibacter sp. PhB186]ROS53140.1 short-subunit dehydrogenase [Rathayibacter sp. PhB185]
MGEQQVALVTGTSSGIGRAVAERLRSDGWRVFGGQRRTDPSDEDSLPLDVTDDDSVRAAIYTLIGRTGRLDALVNNAGVDTSGAIEETTVAEAEALFATNFFGVHRVTREVLPHLRSNGAGRVVVVGSLSGIVPVPFDAFYTASKHALEGWIEALQLEVGPFGIHCTIIEPGFIRTDLRAGKSPVATRLDVYDRARRRVEAAFDDDVAAGAAPSTVADAVAQVLLSSRPPLHKLVGADARRVAALHTLLPRKLFLDGMRKRYRT